MINNILTLYLIGHLLGDFYLQSDSLAKSKTKSNIALLKHSGIYLLSMIIVIMPVWNWYLLKISLILSLMHAVIDFLKKNYIKNKEENISVFLLDQSIHILTIFLVLLVIFFQFNVMNYTCIIQSSFEILQIDISIFFKWILALLIIYKPSSITIKKILHSYKRPQIQEIPQAIEKIDEGIENAGSLIGVLERVIILLLLFAKQYIVIGFILTAKSIARYDKIVKDPIFSENYLLGTLLSLLIAITSYLIIFYKL
jgi:hypothetical protein